MSTVPPTYTFNGVYYNPVFFPTITGFLTLSQANTLYLARSGLATSVAISTTFTGAVLISGLLTLSGGIAITGGVTIDTLTVNTSSTLNGILTINATNSIVGQTTFTLPPILPSGYQFLTTASQTITGAKTFASVITSNGINDSISVTAPTLTASTVCNAPYFNATNATLNSSLYGLSVSVLYANLIYNSSATLPITIHCETMSLPTTTNTDRGFQIGWNGLTGSSGESDFINLAQGAGAAGGGFNFSTLSNTLTNSNLAFLGKYGNQGLTLFAGCGKFRIDDHNGGAYYWTESQEGPTMYATVNGISTGLNFYCGNAAATLVNSLSINSTSVSPNINLNPLSTTTFNVSHPTTTLGDNISSNTTQYATVGYANSISGTSILSLNNTFSGKNTFLQPIQMTIKGDVTITAIGSAAANNLTTSSGTNSTFIGQSAGLLSTTTNADTIVGGASGQIVAGAFFANTVLGSNSHYNGTNNTVIGADAGNFSTSVAYSNSTCIGYGSLITASNQITLGRSTETILMPNNANITNSLTFNNGTVQANLTVSGNIGFSTFNLGSITSSSVFTRLYRCILYIPNGTGLTITVPEPTSANLGQIFTIRRFGTGGGQTVSLVTPSSAAVWCPINTGGFNTSYGISTVWQATFIVVSLSYVQIA